MKLGNEEMVRREEREEGREREKQSWAESGWTVSWQKRKTGGWATSAMHAHRAALLLPRAGLALPGRATYGYIAIKHGHRIEEAAEENRMMKTDTKKMWRCIDGEEKSRERRGVK
jgi:hypothetical protein